jgi:SAM-dependent methyltransferase
MDDVEQPRSSWSDYYKAVADRPPRELFRQTMVRFGQAGHYAGYAIDLGCGPGIETIELLNRGWHVLAIDKEPQAIAHVTGRASSEHQAQLEIQLASFEQIQLPKADFIWAGLSLPFCPPEHFDRLWTEIVNALRPGGRLAADFFGPRHGWAGERQMTFHTAAQIKKLCRALYIEFFSEEEGERLTVAQGTQPWHAFTVVARKPELS